MSKQNTCKSYVLTTDAIQWVKEKGCLVLDSETTKVLQSFLQHINSIFSHPDNVPEAVIDEILIHAKDEYDILKEAVNK